MQFGNLTNLSESLIALCESLFELSFRQLSDNLHIRISLGLLQLTDNHITGSIPSILGFLTNLCELFY